MNSGRKLKKVIFLGIVILFFNNIYAFSEGVIPANNSIISDLNQNISVSISGSENTSTFINWNDSLVLYWNLETVGPTYTYDLSENSIDGVHLSGFSENSSTPIRGQYGVFNGINIGIESNTYLPSVKNDFSYALWTYPMETHQIDLETIFGSNTGLVGQHYGIFPDHGQDYYGSIDDAGSGISIGTNGVSIYEHTASHLRSNLVWNESSLDGWTHVAIVYSNRTPSLYINGIYQKTGIQSPKLRVHPSLNLDGDSSSYGHFNGYLDEYVVFNRTISPQEVLSLYNSQLNDLEFNVINLDNLTQYNYTLYSINISGDVLIENYNFFTNTSYSVPEILLEDPLVNFFPVQNMFSVLFTLLGLFLYFLL
jgi:hypothetical protein